jgi:hypothetical protein
MGFVKHYVRFIRKIYLGIIGKTSGKSPEVLKNYLREVYRCILLGCERNSGTCVWCHFRPMRRPSSVVRSTHTCYSHAPRYPTETADRVDALLAEGLTQRRIARKVGLCLTTVNRIANGNWQHCGRTCPADENIHEVDPASATRCGGCGGSVYVWPCLYCEISENVKGMCARPVAPYCSLLCTKQNRLQGSSADA